MKNQLLLLFSVLLLLLGCNNEDSPKNIEESFYGGWKLSSQRINGTDVNLADMTLPELMHFDKQNVCYLAIPLKKADKWEYEDSRTAWNFFQETSTLNIAYYLPVTMYLDQIDNNELKVHFSSINATGEIDLVEKRYVRANTKIEDLKVRIKE